MRIIVDLDAYTRPSLGRFGDAPIAADPVRLRALLSQLLDLGLTSFLCPSDGRLLHVLSQLRSRWRFEVIPLLVDAARQSRALQTYGFVGFARRRLVAAGPLAAARASLEALTRLPSIARRDYVDGSLYLAALEFAQFTRFRPREVFLHANSSDLATANHNERLFRGFVRMAARRGVDAGVVTNNAGWLVPLLDQWDLRVAIAMPVTVAGYHMIPSRDIALAQARGGRRSLAIVPRGGRLEDLVPDPSSFDAVVTSPPDAVVALTMLG